MKIVEVSSLRDFIALKDIWNDVLQRCDHSIFSTWEWLSTWWKYFGRSKQLLILLAEEKGDVVGIAPLMYSVYSVFGLRQAKIEFIGNPHSDYQDFIIASKKAECLRLFIDHLKHIPQRWRIIELNEISENSQSIAFLKKKAISLRPCNKCPYIPLPKSYDAFLNSLGYNLRANIRRNSRRLKKVFKVEVIDCSNVKSYEYGMRWLYSLHQKRWTQKGQQGFFADTDFCNFHLEIAKAFAKKNWLGLFLLKLSDKPAAAVYGFKYGSTFYFYLQGLDPTYLKYSIGNQLTAYAAGKCIEDQLVVFDFMRGAEIYKGRWTTLSKSNFQATFPKSNCFFNFRNSFYRKYCSLFANLEFYLNTPTR
jgi:CelD/BcsL family acetyltransferase involved in cellulose biosynthesis